MLARLALFGLSLTGDVLAQCQPEWVVSPSGPHGPVYALAEFNDELVAGGQFLSAGGVPASGIARFDGNAWAPLDQGVNNVVRALAVYEGRLVATGAFTSAGGQPAARLAQWDGISWAPLGGGLPGPGTALCLFQGDLIVGGPFDSPVRGLMRWNGSAWTQLPQWTVANTSDLDVYALTTIGPQLWAGGQRWMGSSFSGGFFFGTTGTGPWQGSTLILNNSVVYCLAEYNGQVIIGGLFNNTGSADNFVSAWNGSEFVPLGSGLDGVCYALAVHNGELVAAGSFATAGGQPASGIAKWNGDRWATLGDGLAGNSTGNVLLTQGNSLYVGGLFNAAGSHPAANWAAWTCPCYANCDASTLAPTLNVADFTCFLQRFAAGDSYANCDTSTTVPTLNVADFTCFLQKFAAGCP